LNDRFEKRTNQNSFAASGIAQVIDEFLIKNFLKFDLIICGQLTKHIKDLVGSVLSKINTTTQIIHIRSKNACARQELNHSMVIFTKSRKNLIYFNKRNHLNHLNFLHNFKIFFYVQDDCSGLSNFSTPRLTHEEMNLLPIYAFEFMLLNVKNKLKLKAVSYFSEGKCEKPVLSELNSMSMLTGRWKKKLENFNHLMNFHGCLVSFISELNTEYYADELKPFLRNTTTQKKGGLAKMREIIDRGNLTFRGVVYEIIRAIAREANFTAYYQIEMETLNKKYHSKIASQNNKVLYVDLTIGIFTHSRVNVLNGTAMYHLTPPFTSVDFYYLITPNEFYTNYEKLVLPFDKYTWICFGVSFALTFAAIFVVNRAPKIIKIIIFGQGIKNPTYNVVSIFFGISQVKLPNENFARILITMFIFLCLIFRTCYQSMMFEFMTTDMRKPPPENIEDLVRMNYTVIIKGNQKEMNMEWHEQLTNGREK
jgi:hypothetical protein